MSAITEGQFDLEDFEAAWRPAKKYLPGWKLEIRQLRAALEAANLTAREEAIREAVAAIKQQMGVFLSPEYAGPEPINSFQERFACVQCIKAIEALLERKP